jgi:hypothetical protein
MAGDRSMTIEYKDSKRIVALSTDYVPDISDVSDSNWTVTGLNYAINSGVIDWDGVRDSSVDGIHIDLGAGNISDTQWVLRFKMVTDAVSSPSIGSNVLYIAVSDAGVQPQATGSEDSLGYYERRHSSTSHKQTVGYGDEASLLQNVDDFNTTAPTTETKYIEMKRTSATSFTVTRYSDEFVTVKETAKTVTIPSTIQSLRYIKIQNKQEAASGGTFNGTISDIKFWNDTTTAGVTAKNHLTNVQDNSLLVEKDTARRYWGTDKVTTEAVYTSVTGQSTYEKLSGTAQAYSSEKAGVELVSTANDGKAIKIGKWKLAREGTLSGLAYMKVEDGSGNLKATSTGVDVSSITARTSGYEYVTFTLPTAVKVYNGYRVYIEYTTSDGSGNFLAFAEFYNGSTTIPTGFEFTVYNKRDSGGNNPSGGWADDGLPTLLIPDAIFDDVPASNVTSDITWTMQPTLEYDLSTSAGWTTTGSNCSVNTTGQYLEGSSSTNDDRATKALGLTLSDTKFVIRQKMELVTVTTGGNGQLYFGYTDKDNSTTVLGNRDGIGITIRTTPDMLQSYALNQAWQSSATLSTTPASSTTYYLELIRNSSTSITLNLYSDSDYSTLVETKTNTISSSINGLEYITIGGWDNNASGVITARFSDIQIYNGVTSIN